MASGNSLYDAKLVLCDNGRLRRGEREGTYAYLWLIHVDMWQKATLYGKAIILQIKINKKFKNWHEVT